ncbi:PREDICTED: translation initiation factor eIF-2B subunit beta-like, partial [Rhagoletis zephyria]|uniref:translation initiation factor eIF-2B subunit beta-like n=1 Tax=Rhagoletis zephyria TaxID=28612 RepID=UPI0008115EA7
MASEECAASFPGLDKFIDHIKLGRSTGSYALAKKTVVFLQDFLLTANYDNIRKIIEDITCMGKILVKVDPTETVVGNMTKRVLKIIREEYNHCKGTSDLEETLQTIVSTASSNLSEFDDQVQADDIKESICLAISELLSELETSGGNIAAQALEHIYSDEVIMTIGRSKTVEAFIKYAAKKDRKFQVIIAECAPFYNGHELALSLSKENISTILIPDSAIFSIMSRVNKVIIGTHSIMANGGIKAISGAY